MAEMTGQPSGKSKLLMKIWVVIGVTALFGFAVAGCGDEQTEPVAEESTEVPAAEQEEATQTPEPVTLMPVVHTRGVVEFTRPGSDLFTTMAGDLQEIEVGSSLRTVEADSAALMIFGEGVAAEVPPFSQIGDKLLVFDDDTLLVELTQISGMSYHFVTADPGGEVGRDYTVITPVGEVTAAGTQFWVIELAKSLGWMFIPTQGSIQVEVGERDEDVSDNILSHAANGDCVIIDFEGNVSECDASSITDRPLSDGSDFVREVAPTASATPTSEVVAPVSTAEPTETIGTGAWVPAEAAILAALWLISAFFRQRVPVCTTPLGAAAAAVAKH